MIIVLKPGVTNQQVEAFSAELAKKNNIKVNVWYGEHSTVLGLLGDTAAVDIESVAAQDLVQSVKRVQEPYKKANRKFHPADTVIDLGGGSVIGGGHLGLIAGPCSVECESQIVSVAESVKAAGASFLRGGAFKPRTSPYSFQGLRAEGLELLRHARKQTGLPIVTEIMSASHLVLFEDVDVIQVGARNMQNFELLKELGKVDKPILLKRGLANTIEELLMSAEYIMAGGQRKGHPVRTRHPHVRDNDPQHAGCVRHSAAETTVAPAGRGGSVTRSGHQFAGGTVGARRCGCRRGRLDHRST